MKRGIDDIFQQALEHRELEAENPGFDICTSVDGTYILLMDKRIKVPDDSGLSQPRKKLARKGGNAEDEDPAEDWPEGGARP